MKLKASKHPGMTGFTFRCPGCEMDHILITDYTDEYRKTREASGLRCPLWTFNGDMEKPTFNPSLLIRWEEDEHEQKICHLFIRNGRIQFLDDCSHALAGKTVDLIDAS